MDFTPTDASSLKDETPIVVVMHGLTGGSHESYVRGILSKACAPIETGGLGYRGVVVNFRGCTVSFCVHTSACSCANRCWYAHDCSTTVFRRLDGRLPSSLDVHLASISQRASSRTWILIGCQCYCTIPWRREGAEPIIFGLCVSLRKSDSFSED